MTSRLHTPDALCSTGKVLLIAPHPPLLGGGSVIMRNLLSRFDSDSYVVATTENPNAFSLDWEAQENIYMLFTLAPRLRRLNKYWQVWQWPLVMRKVLQIIDKLQPTVLIAVYPDFQYLKVAREAAKHAKLPWIAYLHDTIVESLTGTFMASGAVNLQEQTFREASSIFVMSQGMADLYQRKYEQVCQPLLHSYLEPIPTTLPASKRIQQAFWGGAIYRINRHALARVSEALRMIESKFLLATNTSEETLREMGIEGNHLSLAFFPKREEYLEVLQQQGVLVLALDWPDESPTHMDELATIFPTKTPEYLAAGLPILVHCPEHYFLARFFKEHGCGLVVSERSLDALANGFSTLFAETEAVLHMREAALATAQLFSSDRISSTFQQVVNKVAGLKWGEKLG